MAEESVIQVPILGVRGGKATTRQDHLSVEEPLEIRLGFFEEGQRTPRTLSLTMRTPGEDPQLAVGFLLSEGILREPGHVVGITTGRNVVQVDLSSDVRVDLKRLERHFYTTSSCGVCGKTSIEALQTQTCPMPVKGGPIVDAATIHRMPSVLRASQAAFAQTGGLHAAALFDEVGTLLAVHEDVGRHNAVDKLLGEQFLARALPLSRRLLLVSGRASFELMQKAIMAGIPLLAAVGAPSSLAVELALEYDVTLLGFVREDRFNIYAAPWRIREAGNAGE